MYPDHIKRLTATCLLEAAAREELEVRRKRAKAERLLKEAEEMEEEEKKKGEQEEKEEGEVAMWTGRNSAN